MKFKRIATVLIAIVIFYFGFIFVMKKYIYPCKYIDYVNKYSAEYDLDPYLVLAIIKTESNFNEDAISNKGAKGLMQIMDSTGEWVAREIGINSFNTSLLYDAETNIKMGCWYLNNLNNEFNNMDLAIAAYNGGSGNVTNWLTLEEYSLDGETLDYIPFPETKKYVDKVKANYSIYKYLYE